MALFQKRQYIPQPAPVYVPVPVQRSLPEHIKRLNVVCTRHGMPVPMRFSGVTFSATGFPVANFRCPMPNCRCEEGYGVDSRTNMPRRIFARG